MKIRVKVTPGARRESFEKTSITEFKCNVKERAENNMANTRVRQLVARHFKMPVSAVRFISGTRSANKVFEVLR